MSAFQGDYDLSPDFSIQISTDGEKLFAQATGQPRFTLRENAQDYYVIEGVPAEIEFGRDDSGQVIKLILNQNGIGQNAVKRGVKYTILQVATVVRHAKHAVFQFFAEYLTLDK